MLHTLQAGRAIAAISVAAFHLSILMGMERYGGDAVFRDLTRLGNRGVDFFFVLSGFIIMFAHYDDMNRPKIWGSYLYRRAVRLFPIYWLYTIAFVLAFAVFGGGADAKLPSSPIDWLTSLTLIRFSDISPPLSVAWSLYYEMAFYAVFSLLILSRKLGAAALGGFMFAALFYLQIPEVEGQTAGNVYTAAYNLYFLFGMGAYWLHKQAGRGWIETAIGGFVALVAMSTSLLPEPYSLLLLAAGFAVLLAGVTKLELSGVLKIPRPLAFIGDASYTIYLTHVSLQGVMLKVLMKSQVAAIVGPHFTYLIVIGATVALGCLAYLAIERPLLNRLRPRRQPGDRAGQIAVPDFAAPVPAGLPPTPVLAAEPAAAGRARAVINLRE